MATNFERGAFAEVDVSGNTTFRIPHAALENIFVGGTTESDGSPLASGSRIKPDYMAKANGTTSSGIIYNNDSDHLTITNGGISIKTYSTDITGATAAADLKKLPTVSAVKEFVSSYVGENAGTDVMAGVVVPNYGPDIDRVQVSYKEDGEYYGAHHTYYTYPAEPTSEGEYQADNTSRGLGGHLVGTVQVEYADKTVSYDKPALYVKVTYNGHTESAIQRTFFPDGITGSNPLEVTINVPIPPNCSFEVTMNRGRAYANAYLDGQDQSTLHFIPNTGVSVTGTTIQNTIVTDVE